MSVQKNPFEIKLTNVRLSYPSLFEKTSVKTTDGSTSKPAYGAVFLLHKQKNADTIKKVQAIIAAITKEEFGGRPLTPDRIALHDSSQKIDEKTGEYLDGYGEDILYIGARNSKVKPIVIDAGFRDGQPIPLGPEDGKPYAGCYVNAVVRFWALNGKSDKGSEKSWGKRICASLGNVQFLRDGEPFGGKANKAEDDFVSEETVEDAV